MKGEMKEEIESIESNKATITELIDSPFIELLIVLKCKSIKGDADINALLKRIISDNVYRGGGVKNYLSKIGERNKKRAEYAAGVVGSRAGQAAALGTAGLAGVVGAGVGAVGGVFHGMAKGADIASSRTLKGIAGSDPQTSQQTSQQTRQQTSQQTRVQPRHAEDHQDIVVDDSAVDALIKKLIEHCDGNDILLLITTMLEVINSRLK